MIFMEAIGVVIVILGVAAGIAWVVRSVTNAQIKLGNADVKNRIESDLLTRIDDKDRDRGARARQEQNQ